MGNEMGKQLKLQHSESVVMHAASRIYAAYITSGKVAEKSEDEWIQRSIQEAVKMAVATDSAVVSDDEIDSLGF